MKMCDCNQGRLPCTCRQADRVTVPREALENLQKTVCDSRYWQQLADILSGPARARTCGAEVNSGQGPAEKCGNYWGAMLIQCAFCKGHDAAMRGEP